MRLKLPPIEFTGTLLLGVLHEIIHPKLQRQQQLAARRSKAEPPALREPVKVPAPTEDLKDVGVQKAVGFIGRRHNNLTILEMQLRGFEKIFDPRNLQQNVRC